MTTLTTNTSIQEPVYSNRDYHATKTQIQGFVADLMALKQSIHKRLETQQFDYPIYSFHYGVNWRDLIGREPEYIRPELIRMVRETLSMDNRITQVSNFEFDFKSDACICSFDVKSIFGEFKDNVEVQI